MECCGKVMIRRSCDERKEYADGRVLTYRMNGWYCEDCGNSIHTQADMNARGVCSVGDLCRVENKQRRIR